MNQQITNEKLIKISSKTPIEKTLELGNDVVIKIKGSVVSTQELDNQDGTINKVYTIKPYKAEIVD